MSGSLPQSPTTPNTCGIMGLIQSGGAFASTAMSAATALQGNIMGAIATIQAVPSELMSMAMMDANALVSRLTAVAEGAVQSLISHITSQLGSLVNNLMLSVSHMAAQAGLKAGGCGMPSLSNTTGSSNQCATMGNFFGSIMGAGESLLDGITSAINSATAGIAQLAGAAVGAIAGITAGIMAAVSAAEAVAAQVVTMITNEVSQLANAAIEMLNFAMTNTIQNLFNNACAKQVIQSVATPQLAGMLGHV